MLVVLNAHIPDPLLDQGIPGVILGHARGFQLEPGVLHGCTFFTSYAAEAIGGGQGSGVGF